MSTLITASMLWTCWLFFWVNSIQLSYDPYCLLIRELKLIKLLTIQMPRPRCLFKMNVNPCAFVVFQLSQQWTVSDGRKIWQPGWTVLSSGRPRCKAISRMFQIWENNNGFIWEQVHSCSAASVLSNIAQCYDNTYRATRVSHRWTNWSILVHSSLDSSVWKPRHPWLRNTNKQVNSNTILVFLHFLPHYFLVVLCIPM